MLGINFDKLFTLLIFCTVVQVLSAKTKTGEVKELMQKLHDKMITEQKCQNPVVGLMGRNQSTELLDCQSSNIFMLISDFAQHFNLKSVTVIVHSTDTWKTRVGQLRRCATMISRNVGLSVISVNGFAKLDFSRKTKRAGYILLSELTTFNLTIFPSPKGFWLAKMPPKQDQILQKLPLQLDSHFHLYEESWDNVFYLSEAYKIEEKVMIQNVGCWNRSFGLQMISTPIWERRSDLQGMTISIGAFHYPGWTDIVQSKNGSVTLTGLPPDAWRRLTFALNLTVKFIQVPDGEFGTDQGNGQFSGAIGMLQRKEIMLAGNALIISGSRARVADPLLPLGVFVSALLYKVQDSSDSRSSSIQWNTFSAPLHWTSWISCLIMVALCTLGLSLMEPPVPVESRLVIAMHSIYSQGVAVEFMGVPSRITVLSMFFMGSMFWYAYSATLTSILASKTIKHPFTSLSEMITETNYRIAITSGSAVIDGLKHGNAIEREVYKSRIYTKPSVEDTIDEVNDGGNVVSFIDKISAHNIVGKDYCHYKWIPGWGQGNLFSFYVQKDSPLKPFFNYQISKLRESGVIHKLEMKWFGKGADQHHQCGGPEVNALGFEKVATVFIFLLTIAAISAVILSLECLFKKKS